MSGVDRDRGVASPRTRRDRWRPLEGRRVARQRTLPPQRLGWTLASLAAVAALAALVIPPLFSSRTAVALLSIDEFQNGLVAPVPFGAKDLAAIDEALAGRLSPSVNASRRPLTLDARYHTAAALRSEVRAALAGLRVATRDTLIMVVRGQTIVAPTADGPQPCLLAEDLRLPHGAPLEIVPVRELLAAIASVPARRIVVILDMGDIRWDPRLGAIAGVVPAFLDEECRKPTAADAKECWILGSHDVHEFSGVSLAAQRGFFLRAVELALEGWADDREWGGDGDGSIELLECARFVAAWTSRWATEESGGRFDQRPVLWKIGVGRVPLAAEGASDVPLLAAGRPRLAKAAESTGQTGTSTQAADQGDAARAAPLTANPAAAAAPEDAKPAVAPPDMWDLIERVSKASPGNRVSEYEPVDYAPHLWRQTTSLAAAVAATPRDGSSQAERASRVERLLTTGLERFASEGPQVRIEGNDTPLARLSEARKSADAGNAVAWRALDATIRSALAARSRAADLAAAALDYHGMAMGSERSQPLARSLPRFLTAIAALHSELLRLTPSPSPVDPRDLTQFVAKLEAAKDQVANDAESLCEAVILSLAGPQSGVATGDAWRILASRLPTANQRRRLAAAVMAGTGDDQLGLVQPRPPIPADRGRGESANLRDSRWAEVVDRAAMAADFLAIFGPEPAGEATALAAVEDLRTSLGGDDRSQRLHAVFRAGQALAAILARIPADIDRLTAAGGRGLATRTVDPAITIDSLLRLLDPRDVDRVPASAQGWVPRVNLAPPLSLAVSANPGPLEIGRPRRVTVAIQSGGGFPKDGVLTLDFDATQLSLRQLGGSEVAPRQRLPVASWGDRNRLVLLVEPRQGVAPGVAARETILRAELAAGTRRDFGEKRFELPRIERLSVTLRGRLGTLEGGDDQGAGGRRVVVDPLPASDESRDSEVGGPATRATLALRPFPGQLTTWSLSLANLTGEARMLEVDLLSLGGQAGVAEDVDAAWAECMTKLARRQPLLPRVRVVATSGPVAMPATDEPVAVTLAIRQPAEPAVNGDAAAPLPPTIPVGGTLGLIIRDRPTAASQEGGEAAAAKPAVPERSAEDNRTWVVRLPMESRRPQSYLKAAAVWSEEERSIRIDVDAVDKNAAFLPAGVVRLRLSPLPRAAGAAAAPALRVVEAEISAARPSGSLRAEWNGGDGPADVAVDVDGYPRAFVFRVDTRPVKGGVAQLPQRDWSQIVLVQPATDFTAVRSAADAEIPVHVAVDIPADMLKRGRPPVEIALGERRQPRVEIPFAPVRTLDSDRQVDWSLTVAEPPAAFGIRADVGDWRLPLPASGFRDVDVTLEGRLRLAGGQSPVVERRVVVFDGSPPELTAPPRVEVEQGKPASILVDCMDGGGVVTPEGRHSGASGTSRIEWAIAGAEAGKPAAWQVLKAADGRTEVVVPTGDLVVGRHDVLIRATDGVGLTSPERTCEIAVTPTREKPSPGVEAAP